jgi:ATP-dependent exoDNAse (exonuclease V) beta subunit
MSAAFTPVDQALREEIRTSLDVTLMVEAGAGTGKTTVLVQRMVEVLRRGPFGVDDIAVMTFTEAAAAELAARLREGLEDALRESEDAAHAERLRDALAGLHRARIETIHAFAANLLRERPVEAGLDPQFEVLDDLGARLAFDRSYEAWLAELLDDDRPEISTALHRGMELKHLREIAEHLHEHRYVLPLRPLAAPAGDAVAELTAWLAREASEIDALTNRCLDEEDKAFIAGRAILAFGDTCRAVAAGGDALALERTIIFRAPYASKNGGNQGHWDDKQDCKDLKALIVEYLQLRDDAQGALRGEAIAGVIPLAEEFVRRFERERHEAGTAEFDDLLLWSRDVVAANAEVRGYFHRRFPRILVDEFQDTDPIQAELIMRISSDGGAEDWRTLTPAPGHLFVVGDPKQSIYRFRRADIAVYDDLRRGTLADGVRRITQNFRSVAGILAWTNGVFDRVLVEEEGVQPANVALVPIPGVAPDGRPGVIAVHGSGTPGLKAPGIREEEGRVLARTIKRAVRVERWPVRDPRTRQVRPCEYRDIAILMPSRTESEVYTDPLEDLGIPFRMEGGSYLYDRQEIRDLISCLHAIDDPNDRISLVAALHSMACGCSDEDIFRWTASGGRLDLRQPLDEQEGAVADGLRLLAGLRRERRGLSLSELVGRVIAQTRLVEVALTLPKGEQAAANLLKLTDEARAFAGAGGGGLRPFVDWLSKRRDEEFKEEEAGLHEETDDVVRIITIHGSKGLEFPIVALAKANNKAPNQVDPIADAEGHSLDLKVGDFATPGWDGAVEREKAIGEAERARLLYVACTRARDHLIVPIIPEAGKRTGLLKWLDQDLPEWNEDLAEQLVGGCLLYDRRLVEDGDEAASGGEDASAHAAAAERAEDPTAKQIDVAEKARAQWQDDRAELLRDASRELGYLTASSVELLWQRPLTIEVNEADGTVVSSGKGPPLPLGDAVHQVMEVVDLANPGSIEPVVHAVCSEFGLLDRQDEVHELVAQCLASPSIARAVAAEQCWREVPFTIPWEDGLAVGRIDLLFVEDGRIVIVDYKTDAVSPDAIEEAVESHHNQAEVYAAAARKATGLDVSEVVFIFCRAAREGACRWE